jgi:thymidylate synthase
MHILKAPSVDELVLESVKLILSTGERIISRAGSADQVYHVSYVLTDSRNRVFHLRHPESEKYFCREMLAFFNGSLRICDGLNAASKRWTKFADKRGLIWSNYGYYVFYERVAGETQYDWIVSAFTENIFTRRAIINLNQAYHKDLSSPDFPCAIAAQFHIRSNTLHCQVFSRSEDAFSGLPYDIAFFSFINELLSTDLSVKLNRSISSGSTTITCAFSQIYDRNRANLELLMAKETNQPFETPQMPAITDASEVLNDIYHRSLNSEVFQWLSRYAELEIA